MLEIALHGVPLCPLRGSKETGTHGSREEGRAGSRRRSRLPGLPSRRQAREAGRAAEGPVADGRAGSVGRGAFAPCDSWVIGGGLSKKIRAGFAPYREASVFDFER